MPSESESLHSSTICSLFRLHFCWLLSLTRALWSMMFPTSVLLTCTWLKQITHASVVVILSSKSCSWPLPWSNTCLNSTVTYSSLATYFNIFYSLIPLPIYLTFTESNNNFLYTSSRQLGRLSMKWLLDIAEKLTLRCDNGMIFEETGWDIIELLLILNI